MTVSETTDSRLATAEQWLEARRTLLEKEKELTRHMDEVSALRRQMPWQGSKRSMFSRGRPV